MKSIIIYISILLAIVVAVLPVPAAHAQWLGEWNYRRLVTIGNNCGEELLDYQVKIFLDDQFDFSKVRSDGGDLRITIEDGSSLIPFWIEEWNQAGEIGCIWAKVPAITADDTLLYLYYGNAAETSTADADSAFELYDGFEDYDTGGAPGVEGGNPGEWTRDPGNPMITEGSSGAWDDHGATFASVIYDSLAEEFRMYYHGFSFSGTHQIGLATASSPEGPWTKYPGNPVLTPGPLAWDGQSVRVPMVWKEGMEDYRMIYTGLGSGGMQIGYATSTDGISWTKHASNPVFNDPTWAHGQTENWGVIKVGTDYLMWYSDFGMRQSGIAVSTDLVTWSPYQSGPIFASSGDTGDERYSQFCPFSFKYMSNYYVLVPSYNGGSNYAKLYLYRSSSPYFPESDRHLVRVAHTVGGPGDWDNHDSDTPFVFTLDVERSEFYNDELRCYYAGEGGSNLWKEGLLFETDIAEALADTTTVSSDYSWSVTGNVTVTNSPVRHGQRSVLQHDTSAIAATQLNIEFSSMQKAQLGAWMQRSSISNGDYDIYLYGGATLCCVAGLGRDGDFHFWNGGFQPTGVSWAVDTWYLVTLAFDASGSLYDFVVYDEDLGEIVRVEGISFGNTSSQITKAMFYTSSGYTGDGFIDDCRVLKWCGDDQTISVLEEEYPTGSTTLCSSSVTFEGSYIELKWLLSEIDSQTGFSVFRTQLPLERFEHLENASIVQEDFAFTFRDNDFKPGGSYRYRVDVDTGSGYELLFETDVVTASLPPVVMKQNHPNPFNPVTTIDYYLPARSRVTLYIYDTSGRRIRKLVDTIKNMGNHSARWDGLDESGSRVSSGVYFYRISTGTNSISKKMILLK